MPLRDHFHPPLSKRASWEGFHGQWPAMIVQHLVGVLPDGYVAEPRVPWTATRPAWQQLWTDAAELYKQAARP